MKEEKEKKVKPKVDSVFLASSANFSLTCFTLLPLKQLPTRATALGHKRYVAKG